MTTPINLHTQALPVYLVDPASGNSSLTSSQATLAKGGTTIATGQVTVNTTATLIVAARTGRNKVTITSTAATQFYIGASGVTAANGLYIAAAAGASITLDTAAAIYGIGSASVVVSYLENY